MRVQQSISWKKYWIGQWKSLIRGTADLIIYIIMWDELKVGLCLLQNALFQELYKVHESEHVCGGSFVEGGAAKVDRRMKSSQVVQSSMAISAPKRDLSYTSILLIFYCNRKTAERRLWLASLFYLQIAAGDLEAVWIKVIKVMELIMII